LVEPGINAPSGARLKHFATALGVEVAELFIFERQNREHRVSKTKGER
jgi:hypothetical protein